MALPTPPAAPVPVGTSEADRGKERLLNLLTKEGRLAPEVASKFISHQGLEAISDFASLFGEQDYSSGLAEAAKEAGIEDRISVSRLRTSWQLARAELVSALHKRGTVDNVDLEEPLPPEVQRSQIQAFVDMYHLRLEPSSMPCDSLLARLFREFCRGQPQPSRSQEGPNQ